MQLFFSQALLNNPKIEVVDGNTFKYKPVYNIKDRKGLLRLLDKNDQRGLGGVFLEDVEESLPKLDKALKVNALQKRKGDHKDIYRNGDVEKHLSNFAVIKVVHVGVPFSIATETICRLRVKT